MALDFYIRNSNDPNFKEGILEIESDIDKFLNQLEILITTNKGDVLGEPNFGCGLESYLWNTQVSESFIKSEIIKQISTYCSYLANSVSYDIDVYFIKMNEFSDACIVDVIINDVVVLGLAVTK